MGGRDSAKNEFAAALRRYRMRSGLTQRHLADLSTLSVRTIRYLESGINSIRPRMETIRLLADSLRLGDADRGTLELAAARQDEGTSSRGVGDAVAGFPPPPRISSLIGREPELRVLQDLVTRKRQRLVAVVGLSGVGKTRLVLELASTLIDEGKPVVWIRQPHDGARPDEAALRGDDPTRVYDWFELLAPFQRAKEALLIIDGLDGGVRRSITSILKLLSTSRDLRVVLTTRDPRGVPAESLFPLSPLPVLAVKDRAGMLESDAFSAALLLLAVNISQVCPGLRLDQSTTEVVTELCRGFDGLPAALEIVGRGCLIYSPEELVAAQARDPLALLSMLATATGPADLVPAIRDCLDSLEPSTVKLLANLAAIDGPWSVGDAADLVGDTTASVLPELRLLLLCGLVCRDAAGFSVLNLVRHALE